MQGKTIEKIRELAVKLNDLGTVLHNNIHEWFKDREKQKGVTNECKS